MTNRKKFLSALRSGEYRKGTISVDDQGRPIIESIDDEGFCAVGLMDTLFNSNFNSNFGRSVRLRVALNLTQIQITKIQIEWNDSSLTFPQIADLIENQMFSGD